MTAPRRGRVAGGRLCGDSGSLTRGRPVVPRTSKSRVSAALPRLPNMVLTDGLAAVRGNTVARLGHILSVPVGTSLGLGRRFIGGAVLSGLGVGGSGGSTAAAPPIYNVLEI